MPKMQYICIMICRTDDAHMICAHMIYHEQHIAQTHHGNGNALSTDLLPILYPIFKIYHRANRTVKRIVRFILPSISSASTVQNSLDSLYDGGGGKMFSIRILHIL